MAAAHETLARRRCSNKRCRGGHSWWSRTRTRYFWCPLPGGREDKQ